MGLNGFSGLHTDSPYGAGFGSVVPMEEISATLRLVSAAPRLRALAASEATWFWTPRNSTASITSSVALPPTPTAIASAVTPSVAGSSVSGSVTSPR